MDFYRSSSGLDIPIIDPATGEGRDAIFKFPGASFGHDPSQRPDKDVPIQTAYGASPTEIKVYSNSELEAMWQEQEEQQSSLEHLYLRGGKPAFVNLDQNGHGYCWAYSTGHALMMNRLKNNLPPVRLNPHSVAAIIKGGRDEGGWSGLSAEFARDNGYGEEGTGPGQWPLHSRNLKYDTPELRQRMKLYVSGEEYVDLARKAWDQNLSAKQIASCLSDRNPCMVDYDEWGHAICAIRWVRVEAGYFSPLILNSWAGWGRHGLGVIARSWTVDGAVCVRSVRAA